MLRRWTLLVVVLALWLSGGCTSKGARAASPSPNAGSPPTSLAPSTQAGVAASPETRGEGRRVTLAFAGDVHFAGVLAGQLTRDPRGVLSPIAPVLTAADLAAVNLETSVTERGTPAPKQFTFRAPPSALTALATAGVDVATMANNHALDYGPTSLVDALVASQAARFPVIGIGRDAAEAFTPYRAAVGGQRISVFGATQVLDTELLSAWTATDTHGGLASAKDPARLLAAVRAARRDADTVVVFLHWGVEGQRCPSANQTGLARQLVDAGADVVVGSHSHRLQGAGRMGSALVAYGLGNFSFYANGGPGTESGVLLVDLRGGRVESYRWVPATIRRGVPHPLSGEAAARATSAWNAVRACTGLAA